MWRFIFPLVCFGLDPPIDPPRSLQELKCNIRNISMFVVKSFSVHSNIQGDDGSWFYSVIDETQLPMNVTRLVVRTCQEVRHVSLLYADYEFQEECDGAKEFVNRKAKGHFNQFMNGEYPLLRRASDAEEMQWKWRGNSSSNVLSRHMVQLRGSLNTCDTKVSDIVQIFLSMFDNWMVNLAINILPQTNEQALAIIQQQVTSDVSFKYENRFGMRWNIVESLLEDAKPSDREIRYAELGIEKGSTYINMLRSKKLGLAVGVDSWHMPEKPDWFNQELEDMYQNVTRMSKEDEYPAMILRQRSDEAWQQFGEGFFDIVFVDALHDFLDVKKDIMNWRPLVRSGGIIAGHDFSFFHFQVMLAVLSEAGGCKDNEIYLASETVWWCKVP